MAKQNKISAGLLMYRMREGQLEVFLAHPGGPLFKIELEWPPRSGKIQRFPEIDRVGFFSIPQARQKLKEAQHPFLDWLQEALYVRAK